MKKVFPLRLPGRVDARVVESVKNDVRKYVKRERRKELPEGFSAWTFSCRVGRDAASAASCTLPELTARIDEAVREGATDIFIEVLAQAGHRRPEDAAAPREADDAGVP